MTASDGLETGGPLAGRRIVVTRAPGQAGRLSALLAAAGATVIEVPLIRIEPVDSASVELVTRLTQALAGDARVWVVVTSPNGAACVSRALSELDAAPDPGPGAGLDPGLAARIRIAAVGGGTKEAIGRPVDLVPERQVAEGLLAEFPPPGPNSTRVVLVQGDLARPILADGLRAAGWNVDQVVAYRNRPNQPRPTCSPDGGSRRHHLHLRLHRPLLRRRHRGAADPGRGQHRTDHHPGRRRAGPAHRPDGVGSLARRAGCGTRRGVRRTTRRSRRVVRPPDPLGDR
ncbi:MAG: uroporphyrinogen-III synthase [Ilumatobacteraceae bacterium]